MILPVLVAAPYVGVDEPFDTYWACYRVLTAAQDARATALLASANQRRQPTPATFVMMRQRQSFWEKVPVHRNLRTAYCQQNKEMV